MTDMTRQVFRSSERGRHAVLPRACGPCTGSTHLLSFPVLARPSDSPAQRMLSFNLTPASGIRPSSTVAAIGRGHIRPATVLPSAAKVRSAASAPRTAVPAFGTHYVPLALHGLGPNIPRSEYPGNKHCSVRALGSLPYSTLSRVPSSSARVTSGLK